VADVGGRPQDSAKAKADAIALAELAEAEAAEAEALAAAARARARAIKLRREAQVHVDEEAVASTQETTAVEAEDTTAETPEAAEAPETPGLATSAESSRRLRLQVARLSGLGKPLAAAAIIAICALLGASGWMLWHQHTVLAERQRSAAFVAAARQGVINLTSLDFNKANEDVQRVLDSATGEFRDDFQRRADDFASVVKDSKAVAQGSVGAAAVEKILSDDSAVVLVLANERVTNSAGAKDDPRAFRFRVTVVRDGDQLKISKVEYLL
jgi:Mce-associated membrane protein